MDVHDIEPSSPSHDETEPSPLHETEPPAPSSEVAPAGDSDSSQPPPLVLPSGAAHGGRHRARRTRLWPIVGLVVLLVAGGVYVGFAVTRNPTAAHATLSAS